MPWETKDIMSLREEFVFLANQEGANRRELRSSSGSSLAKSHTLPCFVPPGFLAIDAS